MSWVSVGTAGASLALGSMSSKDQEDAIEEQMEYMQQMMDKAYTQFKTHAGKAKTELQSGYNAVEKMEKPWMDAGKEGLLRMQAGIREGKYSPGEFEFNFEEFKNDPSYQFRFDETMRMMEQAGAARGKRLSGEQLKALQERGGALASQEYGNAYNRALQKWEADRALGMDEYGRDAALTGYGERATGRMGGYRTRLAENLANNEMAVGQAGYNALTGQAAASQNTLKYQLGNMQQQEGQKQNFLANMKYELDKLNASNTEQSQV